MKTHFKNENRYTRFDLVSGALVDIRIYGVDPTPTGTTGPDVNSGTTGATGYITPTEFDYSLTIQKIGIEQILDTNLMLKTNMNLIDSNEFSDILKIAKEKINSI